MRCSTGLRHVAPPDVQVHTPHPFRRRRLLPALIRTSFDLSQHAKMKSLQQCVCWADCLRGSAAELRPPNILTAGLESPAPYDSSNPASPGQQPQQQYGSVQGSPLASPGAAPKQPQGMCAYCCSRCTGEGAWELEMRATGCLTSLVHLHSKLCQRPACVGS